MTNEMSKLADRLSVAQRDCFDRNEFGLAQLIQDARSELARLSALRAPEAADAGAVAPVAWRWATLSDPNDWSTSTRKPTANEWRIVEPLYPHSAPTAAGIAAPAAGWKLVPIEPTREMTMHACGVLPSVEGVSGHAGKLCAEVYKWMLEASPTTPPAASADAVRARILAALDAKKHEVNFPAYGNHKGDWCRLTDNQIANAILAALTAPVAGADAGMPKSLPLEGFAEHNHAAIEPRAGLGVAGRDAVIEECAAICDKPIHFQHPTKPIGVIISSVPSAPDHAAAIRTLLSQRPNNGGEADNG